MSAPTLRNFHDQIVEAIGSKIVAGGHTEGEQLPTEPQLALAYGASRMIIREAMKSLAAKGLVSIRPRTGTRVQPRSHWNLFDPAVLGWHSAAKFNARFMAELMELRGAIEPMAARLAAQRGGWEQIEELRSAWQAMARATERAPYIEADMRFHRAVVRACGNQLILQLETALSAVWMTSFQASSGPWGPDPQALALHKALLDAIEQRDGEAAEKAVFALIERATVRIQAVAAPVAKTARPARAAAPGKALRS